MDSSTLEAQWPLRDQGQMALTSDLFHSSQRGTTMAKGSSQSPTPSKAELSKAGKTLASDSSSKSAKSKAGSTLGKG